MDVLKDKQYKQYDYISRYQIFPYYYHKIDKKYLYGVTDHLITEGVSYTLYTIEQGDTLFSIALKNYGRPDYYWVLADFNRIQDPDTQLWGNLKTIKIPSISSITYK